MRVRCPKRKADQELPSLICSEIKIGSASVLVCDRSDDAESLKAVHEKSGENARKSGGVFQLETKARKSGRMKTPAARKSTGGVKTPVG